MSNLPIPKVTSTSLTNLLKATLGEISSASEATAVNSDQLNALILGLDTWCQSNELLSGLGESVHAASLVLIVIDEHMNIIVWNAFAHQTTGFSQDDVKHRNILDIFPDGRGVIEAAMCQCQLGFPVQGSTLILKRKTGEMMHFLGNFSPLRCAQRHHGGMVIIAHELPHTVASLSTVSAEVAPTPITEKKRQGALFFNIQSFSKMSWIAILI